MIEIKNVTKVYNGKIVAIDDLSMTIPSWIYWFKWSW